MSILGDLKPPFLFSGSDFWMTSQKKRIPNGQIADILNKIPALEAERDVLKDRVKELEAEIARLRSKLDYSQNLNAPINGIIMNKQVQP